MQDVENSWKNIDILCSSRVPTQRENRENGQNHSPVRENTENLKILPKHREFCLLKL